MTQPFFSEAAGHEFGTFYHHLGLVQHSLTPEIGEFLNASLRDDHSWRDGRSEEEITTIAYQATSLFHETRHLYDAFGTLAGISLIAGHMALLKNFCAEMDVLRASDVCWSLPLAEWAKGSDVVQPRRDFIRKSRAFHVGAQLFLAAFKPVWREGHIDDLAVEIDGPGGRIHAFPLRIMQLFEDEATPLTVFYPLGFETMLEGNAHALARNLVGLYFPDFVADELLMAVHVFDHTDDSTAGPAAATPPYMVADLLISRFMRAHGVEQFPRNIVFGLIDVVLSQSWLEIIEVAPGVTGASFDSLGGMLVELLDQQSIDDLRDGRVAAPKQIDKGYRTVLAELEKGGDWDTVDDDYSLLSSVKIWESYIAQHLTVPLLRERIESDHRAFRSQEGFTELLTKIGPPPVRVFNGRIAFDLPERVVQAWGHVMMLASILHQLLDGRGIVHCPRRFDMIPGMAATNFAAKSHCDAFAKIGCGRYDPGVFAPSPPCHFENILKHCGLTRQP